MKARYRHHGFTLIEILVAAAMILSILSMVYGTYFAISRSTKAARSKLKLSQQATILLPQLARQIRCSYADTSSDYTQKAGTISKQKEMKPQEAPDFFSGNANNSRGEILHLITTNSFGTPKDAAEGLFDVTYRFDKSKGQLYLSQERFIGTTDNKSQKKLWQPIAENIQSVGLSFFDGKKWLNKWIFKDKKKPPRAVNIDITLKDQDNRIYQCNTVAYIYCRSDYDLETKSKKLISAKNK